jgi:hypothetical protein
VPSFINVVFKGNIAGGKGGGFFSNSNSGFGSTVFENVIFSGNTGTDGGGMYVAYCNPSMMNVTITGNNADNGGGIYNSYSNPTFTNAGTSTPVISYSDIQGSGGSASWDTSLGTDGGNNIDEDPLFVREPDSGDGDWTTRGDNDYGNLHLQQGSPAVDTGTNTGAPAFDLDGNSRPIGTSCDIGAYERLITLFLPLVLR